MPSAPILGVGGAVAGFLGGLLGIGGGFLVGPLLIASGFETKRAGATTAYVVTASSLAGFAGHISHMRLPWRPALAAMAGVVAGSQTGASLLTGAKGAAWAKWTYAAVLAAVATKLFADAFGW